jgi:hypothetical protein
MEVEQGKMAAEKASNTQVKAFGQALVKGHTAANQQLMAIAKRKNIDTPDKASDQKQPDEPWMSQKAAAFDRGFDEVRPEAASWFAQPPQAGTGPASKARNSDPVSRRLLKAAPTGPRKRRTDDRWGTSS